MHCAACSRNYNDNRPLQRMQFFRVTFSLHWCLSSASQRHRAPDWDLRRYVAFHVCYATVWRPHTVSNSTINSKHSSVLGRWTQTGIEPVRNERCAKQAGKKDGRTTCSFNEVYRQTSCLSERSALGRRNTRHPYTIVGRSLIISHYWLPRIKLRNGRIDTRRRNEGEWMDVWRQLRSSIDTPVTMCHRDNRTDVIWAVTIPLYNDHHDFFSSVFTRNEISKRAFHAAAPTVLSCSIYLKASGRPAV